MQHPFALRVDACLDAFDKFTTRGLGRLIGRQVPLSSSEGPLLGGEGEHVFDFIAAMTKRSLKRLRGLFVGR